MRCILLEQMGGQASAENFRYCERVAEDLPQQILEKIMDHSTCASLARQEFRVLAHCDDASNGNGAENMIVRVTELLRQQGK
jgi:hypothetical protein